MTSAIETTYLDRHAAAVTLLAARSAGQTNLRPLIADYASAKAAHEAAVREATRIHIPVVLGAEQTVEPDWTRGLPCERCAGYVPHRGLYGLIVVNRHGDDEMICNRCRRTDDTPSLEGMITFWN